MSLPLEKLPVRRLSPIKLSLGLILILGASAGVAVWGISARASQSEKLNTRTQDMAIPTVLVTAPGKPSEAPMRFAASICRGSASMKTETTIPASVIRATRSRRLASCAATSSPPSVVISWRPSGTSMAISGRVRQAIATI